MAGIVAQQLELTNVERVRQLEGALDRLGVVAELVVAELDRWLEDDGAGAERSPAHAPLHLERIPVDV